MANDCFKTAYTFPGSLLKSAIPDLGIPLLSIKTVSLSAPRINTRVAIKMMPRFEKEEKISAELYWAIFGRWVPPFAIQYTQEIRDPGLALHPQREEYMSPGTRKEKQGWSPDPHSLVTHWETFCFPLPHLWALQG